MIDYLFIFKICCVVGEFETVIAFIVGMFLESRLSHEFHSF